MNKARDSGAAGQLSDLPALPATVLTKDRQELGTGGDVWWLRANNDGGGVVEVDYRPLWGACSDRFISIVKLFIVKKAATSAAWSLRNIVQAVVRAVRYWRAGLKNTHIDWSELTVADFQAILSHGLDSPKRCGSYLFDTGDALQRQRLIDLQRRNERALEDAVAAQAAGTGLLVTEWVKEFEATNEGLRIILATEPSSDSAIVAPFEGNLSKYQSLD
ncbi:hypothetical protein [Stenotrophomonas sp. SY1]|uniref:hypothetical protein n=1 Tax=Stenotrophomonas sp. SY1 TaxID=477235 RepID=UPI001E49E020|nr:hypothetical protein [Stenotrophomonas sp. SY1]MCD9087710.1 hypothetical protein [Stenotrophomonas sp. SY1]